MKDRADSGNHSTHQQHPTIDLRPRLEHGDAEGTEPEGIDRALGRERVLDIVHRHRDAQAVLGREPGYVERPAGCEVHSPAHHIKVARGESNQSEREPFIDERCTKSGPLLPGEEREACRVPDADVAGRAPATGLDPLAELLDDMPDQRLR